MTYCKFLFIMENENQMPQIVRGVFSEKDLSVLKKQSIKDGIKGGVIALLSEIPFVGGLIAAAPELYQGYREMEFFRKLCAVILEIKDINEQERHRFTKEVEEKAKDYSGNVLMNMIDRLDNINKGTVLANLIHARTDDKISIDDFFRLVSILERIPYTDLDKLIAFNEPYYDNSGVTELLNATGAIDVCVIDSETDSPNLYELTSLGRMLVQYGLKIDVANTLHNGTAVQIGWRDVE